MRYMAGSECSKKEEKRGVGAREEACNEHNESKEAKYRRRESKEHIKTDILAKGRENKIQRIGAEAAMRR